MFDILINMTIETFDTSNLFNQLIKTHSVHFITENSRDISEKNILYLSQKVARSESVIKLNNLLLDINKSINIELGIFEYSLVLSTLYNLDCLIIAAIYNDKLEDILLNLDENSRLKNKTFRQALDQHVLNPKLVAFLSPEQLHPESWSFVVDKLKLREETENSMPTTDLYKCSKCGERKCTVTELQMRSADEPTNKIITCTICYRTFIQ